MHHGHTSIRCATRAARHSRCAISACASIASLSFFFCLKSSQDMRCTCRDAMRAACHSGLCQVASTCRGLAGIMCHCCRRPPGLQHSMHGAKTHRLVALAWGGLRGRILLPLLGFVTCVFTHGAPCAPCGTVGLAARRAQPCCQGMYVPPPMQGYILQCENKVGRPTAWARACTRTRLKAGKGTARTTMKAAALGQQCCSSAYVGTMQQGSGLGQS
jgi:hypothetical protein